MITVTPNWGATCLQIWKDGAEAGHIEKGRVYVQGAALEDLPEIYRAVTEYREKEGRK